MESEQKKIDLSVTVSQLKNMCLSIHGRPLWESLARRMQRLAQQQSKIPSRDFQTCSVSRLVVQMECCKDEIQNMNQRDFHHNLSSLRFCAGCDNDFFHHHPSHPTVQLHEIPARLLSAASLGVAGCSSQCVSWTATEHGFAVWRSQGSKRFQRIFRHKSGVNQPTCGMEYICWGVFIDVPTTENLLSMIWK